MVWLDWTYETRERPRCPLGDIRKAVALLDRSICSVLQLPERARDVRRNHVRISIVPFITDTARPERADPGRWSKCDNPPGATWRVVSVRWQHPTADSYSHRRGANGRGSVGPGLLLCGSLRMRAFDSDSPGGWYPMPPHCARNMHLADRVLGYSRNHWATQHCQLGGGGVVTCSRSGERPLAGHGPRKGRPRIQLT